MTPYNLKGAKGRLIKSPCSIEERIERLSMPVPESGCRLWIGATMGKGYPQIRINGKSVRVHRWMYEQYYGPITDGLQPDHLCRVPCCIEPTHLEAVTSRENTLRGNGPAARHARKTECVAGHPFTPDNLLPNKYGRRCRECNKRYSRIAYLKRKQVQHG